MATFFRVKNTEEFENLLKSRDIRISEAFVTTILKNLKSKKKYHHALSIECDEDESIYDITINKLDFKEALEKNLSIYEENERYEDCVKIKEALKQLK